MSERLFAALAVFSGKTERQGVSLIDILARAAHTQFGLQRDDILPSEEEIEAFLEENRAASYDASGVVSRDPDTGRFVSLDELSEGRDTPEAQAVLDPRPPVVEPRPGPLVTDDRAPAEMTAPAPELSPAPLPVPPATDERAPLTETGGAQTSSLG